jgi:hypothetical protein
MFNVNDGLVGDSEPCVAARRDAYDGTHLVAIRHIASAEDFGM